MRFLGELYNYEHVDSSVIFETLYLVLVFGHGTSEVWFKLILSSVQSQCLEKDRHKDSYMFQVLDCKGYIFM